MLRVNPTGTKAWYVQLDKNHKRKISDASVLTAAVARYRARDILVRQSLTAGNSPEKGGQSTLGSFLESRYKKLRMQRSPHGNAEIKRLCSALGELTTERLVQVGVSKLERWKLKRTGEVKAATVNRELSMLRTAMDQACTWGLMADNPARKIKSRKTQIGPAPRVLSEPERARLEQVLSAGKDRLSALVLLAMNTGMRRNELFSLRWKDVYFGPNPSIIVEKSPVKHHNKGRRIPLNLAATAALTRWQSARRNRAYLVFPGPSGGQLKSINGAWNRLMKEAQIRNFRLNDCRDDFAVRLVLAGVPLVQVRDLLGHSTIVLTEKYADYAPGRLADAVARLN